MIRTVVCLVLALLVVIAFWPVLGNDFLAFEDERYVTANREVQAGSLAWALTSFHAGIWHPLAWFSHMLDWRLFGPNPAGHHLTSLLLHVANTLLLYLLLERATGSRVRAALVALLFGLHPLHVESVAWVAERKGVLSTLFWLLAIGAYTRWVRFPVRRRYATVLLAAAAALLGKPMAMTLPFTLLLLDYWPLGRRETLRNLIVEKLPLFAMSAVSGVITLAAQQGAAFERYPVVVRVGNAIVAYATYLLRTFIPSRLALPYPHPGSELALWKVALSIAVVAGVSLLAIRFRRGHPYFLFGWLWYLGTLVPVIGIVQAGPQGMADRYTYVPLIGLFVIVAWGIPAAVKPALTGKVEAPAVRRETGLLALCFLIVPVLTVATWMQLRHWQDEMALFSRSLSVTRNNAVAHNRMGLELARRGQPGAAIPHYVEAVELRPDFAEAYNNLGGAFAAIDRLDAALEHFRRALELKPEYPEAMLNMGTALAQEQRVDEAVELFLEALRLRPDYGKAHANLAGAHLSRGEIEAAREEIALALECGFEPPADLVRAVEARSD
ncbi:MAG: tetratricopeptide repeat protein [Planctomycetota bacterium]|jgi:hypothetical protein